MKEIGAQDQEFINWRRTRESNIAIRKVWFPEWEREYWEKDASEPEQPLTPEEQEKVDTYLSRIQDALECRNIKDERARERQMDFGSVIDNFIKLYESTSGGDREAFIRATETVIDRTEQHPGLSAGLICVVRNKLNQAELAKVEPSIKRLSRTPLATQNEGLNGEIEHFKTLRSWDALPLQRAEQIYQSLRNTPPQTSRQ